MRGTLAERFAAKVNRDGPIPSHRPELGPCHIWTGARQGKYGAIRLGKRGSKVKRAHVVAFFLAHGRWPDPCALHHCDVPLCANVAHVFEGTKLANVRDMIAKGRAAFQRA